MHFHHRQTDTGTTVMVYQLKIRLASEQHDSLFGGKHSIASALGAKIQLCYCDFFSKAVIVMMVVTNVFYNIWSRIDHVVCVTQMNALKLTSHDCRTSVQYARKNLQGRTIWHDIANYIVRLTYVHSVWQMRFNLRVFEKNRLKLISRFWFFLNISDKAYFWNL